MAAEVIGPASELDAVNAMLRAITVSPVTGLTTLPPDAQMALQTLRETSRDLQEEGWSFNTDIDYSLLPDSTSGQIEIGTDVLRIDGLDEDYVERNRKLWDRENDTFVFPIGTAVKVDIVRHYVWDTLPSVARRYITALAIEKFVTSRDKYVTANQQQIMGRAQKAFLNAESSNDDLNILTDSPTISLMMARGVFR